MDDEAAIRRVAFSNARNAHDADQTTVALFATPLKVRPFIVADVGIRFLQMDLAVDTRRTTRGDTDPDGTKWRPGHGRAIPSTHTANVPAVTVDGHRHLGPSGCG